MRLRQWLRAPFLLLIAGLAIGAYSLTFTHLAGSAGGAGSDDGLGALARFTQPQWIASDPAGNLYVSDTLNATVRKILPGGEVRTLVGLAYMHDTVDGFGSHARLLSPAGIAVDSAGDVFVVDSQQNVIKKITPAGQQSTFSGLSGAGGFANGDAATARYNFPNGIAIDGADNLYVTEYGGVAARVRKITPGGIASTFAGGSSQGWADGTGGAALFRNPRGIAYDASTNSLLVADYGDHVIRRITIPGAVVTTIAGTHGTAGHTNLNGTSGQIDRPIGIAVNSSGASWIAEGSGRIRTLSATNDLGDAAGANGNGSADGAGTAALFYGPMGLTVNPADGKVYICDQGNHAIRKLDGTTVSTFAGTMTGYGYVNGTGSVARFNHPSGLASYPGPGGMDVFVADRDNNVIRKVTAPGGVVTTWAGSGAASYANGTGTGASFDHPEGVVVDFSVGEVYVADSGNNVIRRITSAGVVSLYAGSPTSSGSTNGDRLTAAKFLRPTALAIYAGKMYVADGYNYRVRVINMGTGVVSDVIDAGTSMPVGFSAIPQNITVDGSGNIFVGDEARVYKITPAGVKSVFAGTGSFSQAPSPYDGTGTGAGFAYPGPPGVVADNSGNGFIADGNAYCVRKFTPGAVITTVGGKLAQMGSADGTGSAAHFMYPKAAMLYGTAGVIVADEASIRVGLTELADVATIDAALGATGSPRQLSTSPNTATSWQWSIIRKPAGSSAVLSSTTIRNPTFTPDIPDLYIFRCIATNATGSSITTVSLNGTGPATSLYVAYPGPVTAGSVVSVNVQALDSFGNDAAAFTGTVHFTSSDANATLAPDYTFTLADHGYANVPGFTLRHSGIQSITGTVVGGGLTSTATFGVGPAAANHMVLVPPATARANVPFNMTAMMFDQFNNVATGYSGTLHFTSTDGAATLPSNYTFNGSDAGVKQFSATLRTGGLRFITATDTLNSSINSQGGTTVQTPNLAGDQNRDGSSDIYWRNYTSGLDAVWLMSGTSFSSIVDLPALPNTNYRISGVADFNGDGQPDILWRNATTGANAIWLMNGTVETIVNLPSLPNPDYVIGGTGDFNGDGSPDILWRNGVTGANAIWLMNGPNFSSIVDLPGLPNPDYHMEGAVDFSGDGKPDIVWRNWVTGANALWLMDGTVFSGLVVNLPGLPSTQYHIGAVGDFDGDTHPDIVWRNATTGANAIWLMNGSSVVSTVNLPGLPNSSYEIAGPK